MKKSYRGEVAEKLAKAVFTGDHVVVDGCVFKVNSAHRPVTNSAGFRFDLTLVELCIGEFTIRETGNGVFDVFTAGNEEPTLRLFDFSDAKSVVSCIAENLHKIDEIEEPE